MRSRLKSPLLMNREINNQLDGDYISSIFEDSIFEDSAFEDSIYNPYNYNVVNSTGGYSKTEVSGTKTAVIFGYNKHMMSSNFGSDSGIEITPTKSNVSLLDILKSSACNPFEITLIRIQCNNYDQLKLPITIESLSHTGQCCLRTIHPSQYICDARFQSNIIDISAQIRIDGNTEIRLDVLPESDFTITFFTGKQSIQLNIKNKSEPEIKIDKRILLLRRHRN